MKDKISVRKSNFVSVRRLIFVFFVAILAFILGVLVRDRGFLGSVDSKVFVNLDRELPEDKRTLDFDLFWRVWNTLETSYYDTTKLDQAKMVYGAIKGMVAAIGDPYTVFLTPDENRVSQEDLSGNFEGVGIQIGFRGNQLAIIAPLVGTPAEEAGLKAGDIIAGLKDDARGIERGTVGITLPEAVQIIRGPAGSKITLSVLREGVDEPLLVELTRKKISIPSIVTTFVGEDEHIVHIQVLRFGGETLGEWNDAVLSTLRDPELRGVIVDVRNNPGGYLQGAIDLGSEFLEKGEVVVIEEGANGAKTEFRVENTGRLIRDKVVLLVNKGSASASEILAGALRDNISALIVGETTFGKGTIQEPRQLEGGVGLHITISRWLTPSGLWVNETGIKPDVTVEDDPDTLEDEQLEEAIKYLEKLT